MSSVQANLIWRLRHGFYIIIQVDVVYCVFRPKVCETLFITRSFRSCNRAFKTDLTVLLALQSQRSADYKAVLDDLLITVDTRSLDQRLMHYCTIARSLCEIYRKSFGTCP